MPSFNLNYANPFQSGTRPYLALQITGPTGANGPIVGLIDSGADSTCLPFGYASLMGYAAADLEVRSGFSADGAMEMWVAKVPAQAFVIGVPNLTFEVNPLFLKNSATPLWGRADLFKTFIVGFDEVAQRFSLTTR